MDVAHTSIDGDRRRRPDIDPRVRRTGHAAAPATACDANTHVHPGELWASRGGGTGVGFRVWARCDGNEQEDLARVASMIESFWAEMIRYMGEPLPDRGGDQFGGDRAMDVYWSVPFKTCNAAAKPPVVTHCAPPNAGSGFNYGSKGAGARAPPTTPPAANPRTRLPRCTSAPISAPRPRSRTPTGR